MAALGILHIGCELSLWSQTWVQIFTPTQADKLHSLKLETSQVAQTVKHLLAMQKTRVRPLGWEDPLEKEMATHFLVWRIPWTEEPGELQTMGSQ